MPTPPRRQGQVRLGIDDRRVREQVERAQARRQLQGQLPVNQPFALAAILDQVLDGAHLQSVRAAEVAQVRQASHGAVGIDDLADHGRFLQSGEAGQVDAALGVAGTDEHAALAGPQSGYVPLAADEVIGRRIVVNGDLDGAGPIERRGAGGDAGDGVDVRREGRGRGVDVAAGQRIEVQPIADRRRHGQADQAAGVPHHEVDRFGRHLFGSDHQVALVLAIGVVDEDDHPPLPKLVKSSLNGAESFSVVRHVPSPTGSFISRYCSG